MLEKSFYRKNIRNLIFMIAVDFLYAISNVCIAFVIQMVVDTTIKKSWNDLLHVLVMGIGVTLTIAFSMILMKYADNQFFQTASSQYKDAILKKYLSKKHITREEETNVYISALTNDYAFIEEKYVRGLSNIMQGLLLVLSVIAMLYYSVTLSILAFLLSLLFICSVLITAMAKKGELPHIHTCKGSPH